jgi:hypothetical protein
MKVVCTDGSNHGEILFSLLDVDGDSIDEVLTRRGRSPVRGTGTANEAGIEVPIKVPARMTVTVPSAQAVNGTWRWKCPQCRCDRRVTNANMRKWIELVTTRGSTTLDISGLPG